MADHVSGPLHTVTVGRSGPPMLFLHPNPLDWSCWLYQMAHFSTWFRTVAVDLPGYGRSPSTRDGVTMPDVTAACWEAIDEISTDGLVVVGCSVGSWVAAYMAHDQPDRVRAIVLSGAGYTPAKVFAPKRIRGYLDEGVAYRRSHAYEVVSDEFGASDLGRHLIELMLERDPLVDVGSIVAMFRALGEPDPPWLWDELPVPCLVITGSLDNAHERALAFRDHIPDLELITIEGAGHTCGLEQPGRFDAAMLDFLERRGLLPADIVDHSKNAPGIGTGGS